MPASVGWGLDEEDCDGGGEVVYGRYDFVRRTVNNVSINEGPSEVKGMSSGREEVGRGAYLSRETLRAET